MLQNTSLHFADGILVNHIQLVVSIKVHVDGLDLALKRGCVPGLGVLCLRMQGDQHEEQGEAPGDHGHAFASRCLRQSSGMAMLRCTV